MSAIKIERRWMILAFAIVYCAFNFGIVAAAFTFWVAPWGHDFKAPRSLIMTAVTATNLMMILTTPFIGRALDFISVRTSLAAGGVVLAAGLVAASFSPSFWFLLALYATVIPIGGAFAATLPATVIAVRLFPGRAGLINGLMALSLSLSMVLMAAFVVPVMGAVGWRGTFLVAAGIVLSLVVIGWFLMNVEAGAPSRALKAAEPAHGVVSADGFNALRQPVFWMLLVAVLPIVLILGGIPPNLAPIAADSGIGTASIAVLVSIFSIACAVGSLGGGWLIDHIGPRVIYVAVLVSIAVALLIMGQRPGFMVMGFALALFGVAGGTIAPWTGAMVMRTFGAEGFARVFGLLTPFYLPASFMPILFGWIRDETGGYQAAFLIFTAMLAPGGLSLLMMRPPAKAALAAAE
jgi:MFS family permease